MFDILKNNRKNLNKDNSLYVNIDFLYMWQKLTKTTQKKKKLLKTLLELGLTEDRLDKVFNKSEETEKNSNQILEFTKEVKNKEEEFKIKIVGLYGK